MTIHNRSTRFADAAKRIAVERAKGKHFTAYNSTFYELGELALRRAARLERGLDRALRAAAADVVTDKLMEALR